MFWILALLVFIPAMKLLRRAGYPGWFAMLLLIPFVNVAFLWWLAFGDSARRFAARTGDHDHGWHCGPRRGARDGDGAATDQTQKAGDAAAPASQPGAAAAVAQTNEPPARAAGQADAATPTIILPA